MRDRGPTLRRLVLVLAVGGLGLLVNGTAAWAAPQRLEPSGAGVTFADDQPIRLDGTTGSTAIVVVRNARADRPIKVQLEVLRLPASVLEVRNPKQPVIPPGGLSRFELSVGAQPAQGEGMLVAAGNDGSVARIPVVIGPPLPTALHLAGLDWAPLVDAGNTVAEVSLEDPPSTPLLMPPRPPTTTTPQSSTPAATQLLGYVSASNGDTARIVGTGGAMRIEGALHSGTYKGTVDLTPGMGGGEITVTLTMRDAVVYPLAVLALGVFGVMWLDLLNRFERPRRILEAGVARLKQLARTSQERQLGVLAQLLPTCRLGQQRIVGPSLTDGPRLLLDVAAAEATKRLDIARPEDGTVGWKLVSAYYAELYGHLALFHQVQRDEQRMASRLSELRKRHDRIQDVAPIGQQAVAALAQMDITTEEQLTALAERVQAAAERLERLALLSAFLDRLRLAAEANGRQDIIQTAEELSRQMLRTTGDGLRELEGQVDQLIAQLPIDRRVLEEARIDLPDSGPSSLDRVRIQLNRRQRWISGVGGALVVATGLLMLYLPNATFGGIGDYLGVALWAVVVTGALQIARRFLREATALA